MSVLELSEVLRAPTRRVEVALEGCSSAYNVGTDDYPVWTWRIGNETTDEELLETVRRLLSERPMSEEHLAEATGADIVRVARTINTLRKREHLTKIGAMWSL